MARPMQRRKNRSGIPKKRQKPKSKKQILANPIVAAAWDSTQTPSQNYRRIGLVSKLNKSSGGKERPASQLDTSGPVKALQDDPLAINAADAVAKVTTEEIAIERDPETGAILRVIDSRKANPLNDPLNDLDDLDDEDEQQRDFNLLASSLGRKAKNNHVASVETEVTRQLEEYAMSGVQTAPRKQSDREEEWVARLVEKHGDDYKAMFWDKELNVRQQSEGDLRRRVRKWKAKQVG